MLKFFYKKIFALQNYILLVNSKYASIMSFYLFSLELFFLLKIFCFNPWLICCQLQYVSWRKHISSSFWCILCPLFHSLGLYYTRQYLKHSFTRTSSHLNLFCGVVCDHGLVVSFSQDSTLGYIASHCRVQLLEKIHDHWRSPF